MFILTYKLNDLVEFGQVLYGFHVQPNYATIIILLRFRIYVYCSKFTYNSFNALCEQKNYFIGFNVYLLETFLNECLLNKKITLKLKYDVVFHGGRKHYISPPVRQYVSRNTRRLPVFDLGSVNCVDYKNEKLLMAEQFC